MNLTTNKSSCYHCGENIDTSTIKFQDKLFCCSGCKTVYELLEQNDLCNYYRLDENPGNQLKHFFSEKYHYLESPEISNLLLDFNSEDYQKITFNIPSIHCSSCIWLLENLKRFDTGIINSQIYFSKKQLAVSLNPKLSSVKKVVDLLCQLGYEPEITLQPQNRENVSATSSNFAKIGVAGFVFGNTMFLSFPEYFGIAPDSIFTKYFTYLSLFFSLPVLLYCANEFYLSAITGLRKKILNIDLPITIGILALFGRSVYEIVAETGIGYLDSLSGLVFFLLIGRWFQNRTYEGLSFDRNFKSYFPIAVTRIAENKKENILIENVLADDLLEIRNEEIIPCDSSLLSDKAVLDYSFVTGESQPVEIDKGMMIYAGGRVKGSAVEIQVTKAVSQSYLTQLWNKPNTGHEDTSSSDQLVNQVSQYFTPTILVIAALAGIYWGITDSSRITFIVSSVLIIACPCALALATPFTFGSVINALSKHKVYLKNTSVIEKLWKIERIIFDKTGTITHAKSNDITFCGSVLSREQKSMIYTLAQQSIHPLSQQIAKHLEINNSIFKVENYNEQKGLGISAIVNGYKIRLGSSSYVKDINSNIPELNITHTHLSIDKNYIGYFHFHNHYRTGLKKCINQLKKKYLFAVLSGDNSSEEQALKTIFPKGSEILFEQSPTDKLNYLEKSQEKTLMIGDGLNDAGALKASYIGASVAENISSFTPASEIIILGDQVTKLDSFLKLIQNSKLIILIGFSISFLYNIVGISFAVMGYITPIFAAILMPLSSITVVAFSTLSIRVLDRHLHY